MRSALLLVIGFLAAARALGSQSRWDRQVDARITQAGATLGKNYYSAALAGRGLLNAGETATFAVTLPAGVTSVLTGVCDDDCADLDLSLSTNGYDVDAARGGGNAPILRVTPVTTTTYNVTVSMGSCRLSPCWFAVGVFRQIATAPLRSPR